jgi:hypothetical protein
MMHRKTYNVLAVAIGSTFTFVWGNLHEALLTSTTDGLWVTTAFLHRDRGKYDRRD